MLDVSRLHVVLLVICKLLVTAVIIKKDTYAGTVPIVSSHYVACSTKSFNIFSYVEHNMSNSMASLFQYHCLYRQWPLPQGNTDR